MPARIPLHPSLTSGPFTIGRGRRAGHSRARLDGNDLIRPFYGVRSAEPVSAPIGYAPRLRPGDRFSHTTAAALWGAPLPRTAQGRLHVTAGAGLQRPRSRGVTGHESRRGAIAMVHGLPVSDAVTTFLELAGILRVDDLVAVGDHFVLRPRLGDPHDRHPRISPEDLTAATDAFRGRHARRARDAAELVRPGAESRMESLLRLLLVRAGLPEPVCAYELRHPDRRIGWFDLAWPRFNTIAEYDGDQHRTSTIQYERDIARFDDAAEIGWRVVRVRKHGIHACPARTVARVTTALRAGGWRG